MDAKKKSAVATCLKALVPEATAPQISAALDALAGKTAAGLAVEVPHDRALTRRQVAELLGVSPHTVSAYARRGLIKAFRLGRQAKLAVGYSSASVRALLEERGRGAK